MTLNGVMAFTFRYFTQLGNPAFQYISASARIELTHKALKFACVTKCNDFSINYF